jgi:hypothetical protein
MEDAAHPRVNRFSASSVRALDEKLDIEMDTLLHLRSTEVSLSFTGVRLQACRISLPSAAPHHIKANQRLVDTVIKAPRKIKS